MFDDHTLLTLTQKIKTLALTLGFSEVGICDLNVMQERPKLEAWLAKHYHGEMQWMENNLELRIHPQLLFEQGLRAIVVRMDYLPPNAQFATVLGNPKLAYISRYALGRDYHKIMRKRLQRFAVQIQMLLDELGFKNEFAFRPFVDSAPVLERPLAAKAGLGWIGKHSLLINQQAGSWFFIGELLINLPLTIDQKITADCGRCVACKTICPTHAIIDDYVVDARRCISYLTIEHPGIIPEALRPLMGNRIYGCDDCQLICPFNQIAPLTQQRDFHAREYLHTPELITLFSWDENTFLKQTEGSPIRRIGYERWLRNIAIALGNSAFTEKNMLETTFTTTFTTTEKKSSKDTHLLLLDEIKKIINTLSQKKGYSEIVDHHIDWAIKQQSEQLKILTQIASMDEHEVLLENRSQSSKQVARLVRSIQKGLPRDAE